MKRLSNRNALVTGASRGIGAAIALAFGREGASVGVNYSSNTAKAEEVVAGIRDLGQRAAIFQADVGDVAQCARMVDDFVNEFGSIDIMVNNAGVCYLTDFLDTTPEQFDRLMNVNLKGVFFCGQLAAKRMIGQGGGKIINVSSVNGQLAEAHQCVYNVSKGGLDMLTKSMAQELIRYGVIVNAIAPGIVLTEAAQEDLADPEVAAEYLTNIPAGRFATCEDIVGAAVFLASRESDYFVGQILTIDGGISIQQMRDLHNKACGNP
jgi:NAD(P)-dependent dehydrogenase (short-subunit alcohol dehydrogenase family)